MQKEVSRERIERLKRSVPKGMITVTELPPFKGEELVAVTTKDLGLGERKAA